MDIRLLVLVSLALRVVLFFAGRFRMCFNDKITWAVYVGADWISGYALTSLSRQDYIPWSLAFFWAPFLLNHLGGQDTITAFSMADKKLWLRQVFYLGSYVFLVGLVLWNSFRRHSTELLASGLLMCVAGIIKHVEKVWALKSGSYESLENSSGRHHYEKQLPEERMVQLPEGPGIGAVRVPEATTTVTDLRPEASNTNNGPEARSNGSTNLPEERKIQLPEERSNSGNANLSEAASTSNATIPPSEPRRNVEDGHEAVPQGTNDGNDAGTVCRALRSMLKVHDIFAANNISSDDDDGDPKLVELQLGLMHDDLYTRCLVLRTRTGLVLRFISVVSSSVAFALFVSTSGKERRYSKADIAISYSLFAGVFVLELCAMLMLTMSPWTWAWFKSHGFNRLARVSWFLYSIRWPLGMGRRRRWPSKMGQCRNMHMLAGIEHPKSITKKLAAMLGKLLRYLGVGEEKVSSWLDKLIHKENVRVDDRIVEQIVTGIHEIRGELRDPARARREWNSLSSFLQEIQEVLDAEFGGALLMLHMVTDVFLSTVEPRDNDNVESGLKSVSEKLSNYMMYLMVNQPSMLPMNTCAASARKKTRAVFAEQIDGVSRGQQRYDNIKNALLEGPQPTGEGVLQELADMWTRVLLYAAGKSPPELHAARLATGGELITVAWLLMAHQGIGNTKLDKLSFTNPCGDVRTTAYAIYLPSPSREDSSSSSPEEWDNDGDISLPDSEENSSSTEGGEDDISSEEENDDVSALEDNSSMEGDIAGEDI